MSSVYFKPDKELSNLTPCIISETNYQGYIQKQYINTFVGNQERANDQ